MRTEFSFTILTGISVLLLFSHATFCDACNPFDFDDNNGSDLIVTEIPALSVTKSSDSIGIAISNLTYTAVSSSEIRPHSTYPIITTLERATSPVRFLFTISYGTNTTLVSKEEILHPQQQTSVFLDIPALTSSQYKLTIKIFPDGEYPSEKQTTLGRTYVNSTVFIQTDKPIYKPSDTVKFRVLVLDRNFIPFQTNRTVDITVRDPQGNIIQSWKNASVPPKRGFLSEKLPLSSEPNLGDWTIQVTLHEGPKTSSAVLQSSSRYHRRSQSPVVNDQYMETQTFSVDEYVLPKFKLDLKISPSFVTYNSPKLTATVSPKYTFGKPIYGKCTLLLKRLNNYNQREVSKTLNVDEGVKSAFVEFDARRDLTIFQQNDGGRIFIPSFTIFASCVDAISGKVMNETVSFKMHQFPYKIDVVLEGSRKEVKPGLNNTVKIRVMSQDGVPLRDTTTLRIEHTNNGKVEELRNLVLGETAYTFFVPEDDLLTPSRSFHYYHRHSEILEVTYKELKSRFTFPIAAASSTRNYLQVTLDPSTTPVEGNNVTLNYQSTHPYESLNLIAMSKGRLTYNERVTFPSPQTSYSFSFRVPLQVAPSMKLIAYTVDPTTKSTVADVLNFDVQQTQSVAVGLSLSVITAEPGTNVTIKLKGLPNSVFGLRAVDESILLLKDDNDLKQAKLSLAAKRFDRDISTNRGEDHLQQQMSSAGLMLLTNAPRAIKPRWEERNWVFKTDYDSSASQDDNIDSMIRERSRERTTSGAEFRFKMGSVSTSSMRSSRDRRPIQLNSVAPYSAEYLSAMSNREERQVAKSSPRVRSVFPETWIWEEVESVDGQLEVERRLPDTITSWSISAFQVNEGRGLGFSAAPASLAVLRPFILSLNLPYSIVQGEVLGLQLILHNYLPTPVAANLSLLNTERAFEFLEDPTATQMTKHLTLQASSVSSVTFPITATKFGTMNVHAVAVCESAGDAMTVPLIVRPPGIKHVHNDAVLIDLLEAPIFVHKAIAVFPENRVAGADSVKVSVVGDILGGTMDNLENLIRLPTGCGEQNMMKFVPNIVVLDYLNATGTLAPHIAERALDFLRTGYQRQLTYLHKDGSFSAFTSDSAGSTWLTAFVVRSFIHAKRYIPVDDDVIRRSLSFLVNQQNQDGSFRENGRIFDRTIQGGSGQNSFAVTAFILLAFQAAQEAGITSVANGKPTSEVLSAGTNFIVTGTSGGQLETPYGNVITAYLLSELNHPQAELCFNISEKAAQVNQTLGLRHWDATVSTAGTVNDRGAKPSSVETTAYALLTYIRRGKLIETLDIVKWLLRQRNENGGFISTQDTVVGITALAKFAEALKMKKNTEVDMRVDLITFDDIAAEAENAFVTDTDNYDHLVVDVSAEETPIAPTHTFYIGKDNVTTLQELILPVNVAQVHFEATGKGTTLAQLTWSYYVHNDDSSRPDFSLIVNATSKDGGRVLDMRTCAAVIRGGSTNMAIMDITAPSGFEFDKDEMDNLHRQKVFSRYELEDKESRVILYFDSISTNSTCVNIVADRTNLVAELAEAPAVVYDYYDTTRRGQVTYSVPSFVSRCDLCASDASCHRRFC